jgi:hypothetical protein
MIPPCAKAANAAPARRDLARRASAAYRAGSPLSLTRPRGTAHAPRPRPDARRLRHARPVRPTRPRRAPSRAPPRARRHPRGLAARPHGLPRRRPAGGSRHRDARLRTRRGLHGLPARGRGARARSHRRELVPTGAVPPHGARPVGERARAAARGTRGAARLRRRRHHRQRSGARAGERDRRPRVRRLRHHRPGAGLRRLRPRGRARQDRDHPLRRAPDLPQRAARVPFVQPDQDAHRGRPRGRRHPHGAHAGGRGAARRGRDP